MRASKKKITIIGITIITLGILFSVLRNKPVPEDNKKFDSIANDTYRKLENTLTLHVISSPYGIKWDGKPRDVLFNIIRNKYFFPDTRRTLGHVTVELNCSVNGKNQRFFGGQGVLDLLKFSSLIRKDGVGFSILNSPMQYTDLPQLTVKGHLEDYNDLYPEYNELIFKEEKMAFLTYKFSNAQCLKMKDFFLEYKKISEETKDSSKPMAANNYGFGADPLKFEGAGCAPFAESFFRLVGLEKESKLFNQTVYIDESLLGNPSEKKKASLVELLTSSDNISKPGKGRRKFIFPDPDLMFSHAKKLIEDKSYNPTNIKVETRSTFGNSKAHYVVIDLGQ